MWESRERSKAAPIKPTNRFTSLSTQPPTEYRKDGCYDPSNHAPAVPTSLWQLALIGVCVIVSIMFIVGFAQSGISTLINVPAISFDHGNIQKSLDSSKQRVIDADIYYERRARETEEGFNSAFPFHS